MPLYSKMDTQTKYAISLIDQKEYCKTSGHFSNHLKQHHLTEEEYVTKFEGRIPLTCDHCKINHKFFKSTWEWSTGCRNNTCDFSKLKKHWANLTPEQKLERGKKSNGWRNDPDKVEQAKKAVLEGNFRVGADGLTGYQRGKLTREKTMLEKTGHKYVTNTWKNISAEQRKEHANKIRQGVLKKYGVENVWQRPAIIQKLKDAAATPEGKLKKSIAATKSNAKIAADPEKLLAIHKKRSATMLERYGTENPLSLLGKVSKISLELFDGIKNVTNVGNYHGSGGGEHRIGLYFVDFAYEDKVIEFYGDFWHANPQKYVSDDFIRCGKLIERQAKDIWAKDKVRIDAIEEAGYKIKIVWEKDFRADKQKIIRECIEWLMQK